MIPEHFCDIKGHWVDPSHHMKILPALSTLKRAQISIKVVNKSQVGLDFSQWLP